MVLKSLLKLSCWHLILETPFGLEDLLLLFKILCNEVHLVLFFIKFIQWFLTCNLLERLVFRVNLLLARYALVFYSLECFFMLFNFHLLNLCYLLLVSLFSHLDLLFIVFKLLLISFLFFLFALLLFFIKFLYQIFWVHRRDFCF